MNDDLERIWKEKFLAQSKTLPGETEAIDKKPESVYLVFTPRFKPSTS